MRWRSAVTFAGLLPLVGCATPDYLPPSPVIVHSSPAEEVAPRPAPKPLPKAKGKDKDEGKKDAAPTGEGLPAPKKALPAIPDAAPLPAPRPAPETIPLPRVEVLRTDPDLSAPVDVEPLIVPAIPAPTPALPSVPQPPAPLPATGVP